MSTAPAAGFRFSTIGRTPGEAFDEYRSIFSNGAEAIRYRPDFRADLTGVEFTRMVVQRRRLSGVRHVRNARLVRRTDFSHFTVTLCLAGSVAAAIDGETRQIRAGEVILVDTTRPGLIETGSPGAAARTPRW